MQFPQFGPRLRLAGTRLREHTVELARDLRPQKVRAALSLLSVAWGTLSILLLLAFSFGFEDLFITRSKGIGDSVAIAWPLRTTKAWQGYPSGRPVLIERDDVLALRELVPELHAVSSEFAASERVHVGANLHRVPVSGVDPAFASLRMLEPRPGGRFLHDMDLRERRRVVFVGDALAISLFGTHAAVGKTIELRDATFTVVGVLQTKEQDSDYNGQDRNRAWIPATTFAALFGVRRISDFVFRAKDPRRQEECARAVVAALARRLAFDPNDRDALEVWDTTESLRMLFFIFLGFHVMLGLSGAFTLLVGGVGIANLMVLMVRRRRPEIGLKLAVGAEPRQILREWLAQALLLVALGAFLGAAVAFALIALVGNSALVQDVGRPHLPLWLTVLTVSLIALVGLLAGYFPARAASRVDPIEALRS